MRTTLIGLETNIFKWIHNRIYNLIKMVFSIFETYLDKKYRLIAKRKRKKKCKKEFNETLDKFLVEN